MEPAPTILTPLTDEEFDALEALIDSQTPLRMDGLLGVMHAVAIAPSTIPLEQWLGLVEFDAAEHSTEDMQAVVPDVVRLYNEVVGMLDEDAALLPEVDDVERFASFAKGYIAAAQLDPVWLDDPDYWAFTEAFALLADRPELVQPEVRAKIEARPDYLVGLRENAGEDILDARDTFLPLRAKLRAGAESAT